MSPPPVSQPPVGFFPTRSIRLLSDSQSSCYLVLKVPLARRFTSALFITLAETSSSFYTCFGMHMHMAFHLSHAASPTHAYFSLFAL
ncbi:hypothetical protein BDR06DRAFT_1003397 [Suillus hirtellus]|nr:hypothetical protein BDR06DRAFT_1003397 [Suillus hirtellus]